MNIKNIIEVIKANKKHILRAGVVVLGAVGLAAGGSALMKTNNEEECCACEFEGDEVESVVTE